MTKIIPEKNARQGRWGWHALIVLVVSLLLAMIVWAGVEYYGEALDRNTPAAETPAGG